MKFVEIRGWNCELAKDQPEFQTIRVRRGTTHIDNGNGILVPYHSMTAQLKPTPEELALLNKDGSVYLNVLSTGWPPVSLETYDPLINEPSHGSS